MEIEHQREILVGSIDADHLTDQLFTVDERENALHAAEGTAGPSLERSRYLDRETVRFLEL